MNANGSLDLCEAHASLSRALSGACERRANLQGKPEDSLPSWRVRTPPALFSYRKGVPLRRAGGLSKAGTPAAEAHEAQKASYQIINNLSTPLPAPMAHVSFMTCWYAARSRCMLHVSLVPCSTPGAPRCSVEQFQPSRTRNGLSWARSTPGCEQICSGSWRIRRVYPVPGSSLLLHAPSSRRRAGAAAECSEEVSETKKWRQQMVPATSSCPTTVSGRPSRFPRAEAAPVTVRGHELSPMAWGGRVDIRLGSRDDGGPAGARPAPRRRGARTCVASCPPGNT